jgi:hypothetical protein
LSFGDSERVVVGKKELKAPKYLNVLMTPNSFELPSNAYSFLKDQVYLTRNCVHLYRE